jgi:hypothetical protein
MLEILVGAQKILKNEEKIKLKLKKPAQPVPVDGQFAGGRLLMTTLKLIM